MKKTFLLMLLALAVYCVLSAMPVSAESPDAFAASYLEKLNAAPGESLDEAQALLDALLSYDGTLPDAAVSDYMDFLYRISNSLCDDHWEDAAFAENLGDSHLISPRYGEGGIGYGANYGAVHAALGDRLSEAYDRYFEIRETYFSGYLVDDMALMISWDDLAQFLVDWSVFRISYPRFVEIDSVDGDLRFAMYLYAGCFNLDNTPVIDDDDALSPEVKASYEKFLNDPASGDVLYRDDIENLYELWRVNSFTFTQDVQDFIEELEAKLYE